MKFKIHVTTEDGELLNTQDVNTDELNWSSTPTRNAISEEIFDEMHRAISRANRKDK